jgi:hypothetical protein
VAVLALLAEYFDEVMGFGVVKKNMETFHSTPLGEFVSDVGKGEVLSLGGSGSPLTLVGKVFVGFCILNHDFHADSLKERFRLGSR